MSDKAETMELKLHANRGEWVATVHTVRCTAPWLVKLGEKFYVRTSEPGESSFVYDHAERALSMTEVENAFDANLSVEVSRVEYAGTGVRTTGEVAGPMPSTREPSCPLCEDTGTVHFKGGDENCAACHARIVLDTDSPLPSTPDPVNPGELPSQTITVTTSGAATPPYPNRYLGTPTNDGSKGEVAGTPLPRWPEVRPIREESGARARGEGAKAETETCAKCDGTGHWYPNVASVREQCPDCGGTGMRLVNGRIRWKGANATERPTWAGPDPQATIAEQAAEIERLKMERDTHLCPLCHGTGMVGNVNDREACERCEGSGIDAYTEKIAELTTERDALRLEVQRLKDLNFEAQDRYAALEAERDALKEHPLRAIAERQREDFTRLLDEANDRAEKYLRVIKAKDLELFYTVVARSAALKACAAMAEAGLPLHVIEKPDHE